MKINLILWLLLIITYELKAQESDCSCSKDFQFVKTYIEQNHPGFKTRVNKNTRSEYDSLVYSITQHVDQQSVSHQQCLEQMRKYLTFMNDNHLSVWKPDTATVQNTPIDISKVLVFEEVDDQTNFVAIRSFKAYHWREIDAFYDEVIPKLNSKPYLILDVRNNSGGGERMYHQLLKFLVQGKSNPKKITLLQNRHCASACEMFIYRLGKNSKTRTFGENTKGVVAFGEIKQISTPYCNYQCIVSTKQYKKYLPFESIGIAPGIHLSNELDWIKIAREWFLE